MDPGSIMLGIPWLSVVGVECARGLEIFDREAPFRSWNKNNRPVQEEDVSDLTGLVIISSVESRKTQIADVELLMMEEGKMVAKFEVALDYSAATRILTASTSHSPLVVFTQFHCPGALSA
jgi:hypothetical protein